MTGIYGQTWLMKYPTPEASLAGKHEWGLALSKKTSAELKRGADLIRKAAPDYPPTSAAFAQMCTIPAEQHETHYKQISYKVHPSVAEAWINAMRGSLLHGPAAQPWSQVLKNRDQVAYRQMVEDHEALLAEHQREGKIVDA